MNRRLVVAIPARNEETNLPQCLVALASAASVAQTPVSVVILANNCDDRTAELSRCLDLGPWLHVEVIEARLPPERAHAGWARRLALDAGARHLKDPGDLLMSTDADTLVANDWLLRTKPWFDRGYDAVAGLAQLNPRELRTLADPHRARLAALRRYDNAIRYLKAMRNPSEPWPRHFYEGGASMALTFRVYDAIGGAPTPSVGEDKALFEAVRKIGGKVRHPVDVRVLTSCRLVGRAAGGTSDTLALWGALGDDGVIFGVKTIAGNLDPKTTEYPALTFRQLPDEINRARALVHIVRSTADLAAVG